MLRGDRIRAVHRRDLFDHESRTTRRLEFPKLQITALVECGSHACVGAVLGSCRTGERTLAGGLADAVEPDMLVLADSVFYFWELFGRFADSGADLAWRIGASVSVGKVAWLADGSYLALIYRPGLNVDRRRRLLETAKTGGDVPGDLARLVRVVEYTVPDRNPGGELIAVITTILDPNDVPALDLARIWPAPTTVDATLITAHSAKQGAAVTFKKGFGFHPLAAWCANTGESLAMLLRPGNAGSNPVTDHLRVLGDAIAQLPPGRRAKILIRIDGAGATHDLLEHLDALNTGHRTVRFTVGWTITEADETRSRPCPRPPGHHRCTRTAGSTPRRTPPN